MHLLASEKTVKTPHGSNKHFPYKYFECLGATEHRRGLTPLSLPMVPLNSYRKLTQETKQKKLRFATTI
jgi:hypothetical protein